MQEKDAEELRQICRTALGHETTDVHLRQRIRELTVKPQYHLAVYEDDHSHKILGFIQAEQYELLYGGNGWNVIALAVAVDSQRQGVGRQLLQSLEELAVHGGASFIRLNCNVIRKDAHDFYRHMEYRNDKTQKRFIKSLSPGDIPELQVTRKRDNKK